MSLVSQLRQNFRSMPYFQQRVLEAWNNAECVEDIAQSVGCFVSQVPEFFTRAVENLRHGLEPEWQSIDTRVLLDCLFVSPLALRYDL